MRGRVKVIWEGVFKKIMVQTTAIDSVVSKNTIKTALFQTISGFTGQGLCSVIPLSTRELLNEILLSEQKEQEPDVKVLIYLEKVNNPLEHSLIILTLMHSSLSISSRTLKTWSTLAIYSIPVA